MSRQQQQQVSTRFPPSAFPTNSNNNNTVDKEVNMSSSSINTNSNNTDVDEQESVIKLHELGSITGIFSTAKILFDAFMTPYGSDQQRGRSRNPRFELQMGTPCGAFNLGGTFDPNTACGSNPAPSLQDSRRRSKTQEHK